MSVKAILLKARRINASRVSNSSSDSLRVNVILITNVAIQIAFDGYPLDSPRHNRLWFMRVNKMRKREGLLALIALAVTGVLLGWFIHEGKTNSDKLLGHYIVPVSKWSVTNVPENVVVMDAADDPQISRGAASEQFGSLLFRYFRQMELSLPHAKVVPEQAQRFAVWGYDGIIDDASISLPEIGVICVIGSGLHLDIRFCRDHETRGLPVVGDSVSKSWRAVFSKVRVGIDPIYEQPRALLSHNGFRVISSGVGRLFGRCGLFFHLHQHILGGLGRIFRGDGLNFYLAESFQTNQYAPYSDEDQPHAREYLWPVMRLVLGACLLYYGGRIAYAGGDSSSRYASAGWGWFSYTLIASGGLLLLARIGW